MFGGGGVDWVWLGARGPGTSITGTHETGLACLQGSVLVTCAGMMVHVCASEGLVAITVPVSS